MNGILIVEDVPAVRSHLRTLAQQTWPHATVSEAATAGQARAYIASAPQELALLDIGLPDGNGVDLIAPLLQAWPQCTVVMVTLFDDDTHIWRALRQGAQGYLLKDQTDALLLQQLAALALGQPPLSPAVAQRLMSHFARHEEANTHSPTPSVEPATPLTARELDVLRLLGQGKSATVIAQLLGISRHTVGDHIKQIYRKLAISSRAQAALHAQQRGLV